MWTPTTRRHHIRQAPRYASDLTDAEWRLVVPYLPPHSVGENLGRRQAAGYDAAKKILGRKALLSEVEGRHAMVDRSTCSFTLPTCRIAMAPCRC